jgi:hypothetical protein
MRTNGHAEVDEDNDIDKLQFNEEDYNGHDDDDEIEEEEEEDNSDYKDFELIFLCKTSICNEIDINVIFPYVVVL